MSASVSGCCGSIPPVITRSAHARSRVVSSSAFRLTSRIFQAEGSSAARVMRPSGGAGQRTPTTSQTAWRFQNEFASNLGKTIKTLVGSLPTSIPARPKSGAESIGRFRPIERTLSSRKRKSR